MINSEKANYDVALRDFQRARKQAALQQILARLRGESNELLCYDTVRQQLKVTGAPVKLGLQEIPLDKIVGSVGRFEDFSRSFLPLRDTDQERWVGVKTAVQSMKGMPPIEVYQVGDSYFVQDGNHRVSIARQLGTETISAYVTKVDTRVPLTAEDDASEIICKSFYADFLEQTNLDAFYPDANLLMTFCDEYDVLLGQIRVEAALMGQGESIPDSPYPETAVRQWYENVYLPVIRVIREMGILYRFPQRTETDLYLVLSERHNELEEALGWEVEMETAVSHLVEEGEVQQENFINRLLKSIMPGLEPGPKPGVWRRQQLARQRENRLFEHMLVEVNGREDGWLLLDQLLEMAKFDQDHILGLHVVPDNSLLKEARIEKIRRTFIKKSRAANIKGELAVEVNPNPYAPFISRAAWADLIIVSNERPPAYEALPRLDPQLKQLIQLSSRPLLIVPMGGKIDFSRACLGYDGSAKAKEALYMATYMASKWGTALTVVTVETNNTSEEKLNQARHYIESHGVNASYHLRKEHIVDSLLQVAEEEECTYFVMGGFSYRPFRHLVLGSTAEGVLRESQIPVFICR